MRTIILAVLVATGIGLAAVPTASAAPASGKVIDNAAGQNSNVAQVQHWRWGSGRRGGHWRWGSRGHRPWGRCHIRYRSGWVRC
jgi:hypothetical protein